MNGLSWEVVQKPVDATIMIIASAEVMIARPITKTVLTLDSYIDLSCHDRPTTANTEAIHHNDRTKVCLTFALDDSIALPLRSLLAEK